MIKKADNDHTSEIKALRPYIKHDDIILHFYHSALQYPNIVLFMGYTYEEDNIQIITNYVDGSDLHWILFTEVQRAVATHTSHIEIILAT